MDSNPLEYSGCGVISVSLYRGDLNQQMIFCARSGSSFQYVIFDIMGVDQYGLHFVLLSFKKDEIGR